MAARGFVLVTGASRGIGRTVAADLARRGFSVFAGVRQREDGARLLEAGAGAIEPLLLDVTRPEAIARAETEVRRRTAGRGLAGLVNNAAMFLLGPFEQTSLEAVDLLFRVNVLGIVAVTQRFLPLLRQGRGRLVNVSSVNGRLSFPFASFYSASKFAIEALSDALRVELEPWNIDVSVVEPGFTRTEIRSQGLRAWTDSRAHLDSAGAELYEQMYRSLGDLLPQVDTSAVGHDYVVSAVYDALTAATPQTRYLAGPDAEQWVTMATLADRERDAAFAKMFAPGDGAG